MLRLSGALDSAQGESDGLADVALRELYENQVNSFYPRLKHDSIFNHKVLTLWVRWKPVAGPFFI